MGLGGLVLDNHGFYNPPALKSWSSTGYDEKKVKWVLLQHDKDDKVMEEDELLPLEKRLWERARSKEDFWDIHAKAHVTKRDLMSYGRVFDVYVASYIGDRNEARRRNWSLVGQLISDLQIDAIPTRNLSDGRNS